MGPVGDSQSQAVGDAVTWKVFEVNPVEGACEQRGDLTIE